MATVHGGHKESAMTKHTRTRARTHTHNTSQGRWAIFSQCRKVAYSCTLIEPRHHSSGQMHSRQCYWNCPPFLAPGPLSPAQLALGSPLSCCQGTRIMKSNWKSRLCWCEATAGVRGAALVLICPLKCRFSCFPVASLKTLLHVSASFQVTDQNVRPESQAILNQFYLRKPCSREA